jgi:hypothetical protein
LTSVEFWRPIFPRIVKVILTTVSAAAALAFAGCSKPTVSTDSQQSDSSSAPASTPTPAPPPLSTGPEKTPIVSTAPTPPPKVYAPEGTLFALQRITITNDDGVFSILGGTKLKIIRKTAEGYVVSDGKREFPVDAGQVTNEVPGTGATAVASNTNSTQPPAIGQSPEALQAELARTKAAMEKMAIDAKARFTRIQTLQGKSANLASEIVDLNQKIRTSAVNTRETSLLNRNTVNMVDPSMMAAWKQRLAADLQEKAAVEREIIQLQQMH